MTLLYDEPATKEDTCFECVGKGLFVLFVLVIIVGTIIKDSHQ